MPQQWLAVKEARKLCERQYDVREFNLSGDEFVQCDAFEWFRSSFVSPFVAVLSLCVIAAMDVTAVKTRHGLSMNRRERLARRAVLNAFVLNAHQNRFSFTAHWKYDFMILRPHAARWQPVPNFPFRAKCEPWRFRSDSIINGRTLASFHRFYFSYNSRSWMYKIIYLNASELGILCSYSGIQ